MKCCLTFFMSIAWSKDCFCFKLKKKIFLYLLFIPYNHASEIYCISEIDSFLLYHNMPFSKSMYIYIHWLSQKLSFTNLIKCKSIFSFLLAFQKKCLSPTITFHLFLYFLLNSRCYFLCVMTLYSYIHSYTWVFN